MGFYAHDNKNQKQPSEFTPHSGKKVWWKCKKGHEWVSTIDHRSNGRGCPICGKILLKNGAACESLLEAYYYLRLKARGIKFIHNKKYESNSKRRPRFDFYIPKYKTYIEVTGYNKFNLRYFSGRWFSYLRNIAKKKKYVEQVLHKNFRFIQMELNKKQIEYVRKNMY